MKKINGEIFNLDKESEELLHSTDDEINKKYKRGEIRIVTEQARYPIDSIKSMIASGKYKLNPEYQRRKIWDKVRKSRLIESFIMNVPLPPIFLYEYEYSKYEVMDGLQRLSTIDDFYNEKFSLEGLEYWKELHGKTYKQLPSGIQKGIDRRYISSIVLLEETAKTVEEAEELKQIVFERLNSGGETLTPQETRNALYNGKFNELCIKLSKNETFKRMWNIPNNEESILDNDMYKKMQDVELVLRFFAYRHIDKSRSYSISTFLNEYLKQANLFSNTTINELENIFIDTLETTYSIFGKDAFFLPEHDKKRYISSKTIYDSLMQSMCNNLDSKEILIKNKKEIKRNKYANKKDLKYEDGKTTFNAKYAGWIHVSKRIEYFNKLFEPYIK